MVAREARASNSIWNNRDGWTMPPMPTPQVGEVILAIEPSEETISEWDAEDIAASLGYRCESRYLGENKISDPLATDVFIFLGVYPEAEIQARIAELLSNGMPGNAIKKLSGSVKI
jgi:hypothetical protein